MSAQSTYRRIDRRLLKSRGTPLEAQIIGCPGAATQGPSVDYLALQSSESLHQLLLDNLVKLRSIQDFMALHVVRLLTTLMCAMFLVSTSCLADGIGASDFGTDWSQLAIERFHKLYNLRTFQQIYAEYDDEYTAEISPQRQVEMFGLAREQMGRFISATSVQSKSETRHGEQVFVVTELAMFECGPIREEFVFKQGNPAGKLLAYKF